MPRPMPIYVSKHVIHMPSFHRQVRMSIKRVLKGTTIRTPTPYSRTHTKNVNAIYDELADEIIADLIETAYEYEYDDDNRPETNIGIGIGIGIDIGIQYIDEYDDYYNMP